MSAPCEPPPVRISLAHARWRCVAEIAGVLVAAMLLTEWLVRRDADLRLARQFYDAARGGWFLGDTPPWGWLYQYGPWPALALAGGGLVALGVMWWRKNWRGWRTAAFLPLLMLLGPGLVVNAVLKEHWGRPRPRQLTEFGGEKLGLPELYLPPWQRGMAGGGRFSFPSGHASMGFFLMGPFFLLRHSRRRSAAWLALGGGAAAGLVMGFARITQGGHFLTDVLWAGVVVFVCGRLLEHAFFAGLGNEAGRSTRP